MMRVLAIGLDVGGANIKLARVVVEEGAVVDSRVLIHYFPIWRRGKERLAGEIRTLLTRVGGADIACLTMTAELSDVYADKEEGVRHVIEASRKALGDIETFVLDCQGSLLEPEEAMARPMEVAAANWYASGWLAAKLNDTCLVVDTGSTTTSIVPVVGGRVAAKGRNDLEKLMCGELVYTGALRTNVAAIVHEVPVRGRMVPVSSEYFAQSGDVHLVLGNIGPEDYTVDTPDGRGVSLREAAARIARVVCADLRMLSLEEVRLIAEYVYRAQLRQIEAGLYRVLSNFPGVDLRSRPAYTAGVGGEFLAARVLRLAGFRDVRSMASVVGGEASRALPAYALALMGAERALGREVRVGGRGHVQGGR